ncbi:hypothetical protein [Cupriavidus gilardii]|uniref:hypothetical protein n=1 Tax=Cupriavidus gilardii TaxID=82541 RepID=UPI001573C0EF|nr:hypothetical protein [Cupriavidus gilardii]NSX03822.1 hypothetical protein [Cupriavidus gilardii]
MTISRFALTAAATALVATLTAAPAFAKAGKFDPYTDGARTGQFDVFSEGARQGQFDVFTEGARQGKFDVFTEGAAR